jgi:hypothetical protein
LRSMDARAAGLVCSGSDHVCTLRSLLEVRLRSVYAVTALL